MGSTTELRNYYKEVIIMRTMKKTIAFVLAFAMTFATAFSAIGAKTTASAASAADFDVVLYSNGVFEASGANYQVQVALATVKNGTAKAIANWDTYDVDGSGDASGRVTFNPKKDAYYAFRTVSGDGFANPIFFKVVKHADKYKATVTPSGDAYKVSFTGATCDVEPAESYQDVKGIDPGENKPHIEWLVEGATVKTGGVIQFIPEGSTTAATVNEKVKYNGVDCVVSANAVKANAKTVNVKIKKQANGPKVAINYAKGIATIPANCYYRYISGDAAWGSAEWKKVTSKTPVDLTKDADVVVQVKKDATTKAIESKIGTGTFTRNVLDLASADAIEYDNDDLTKKGLKITNKSTKTDLQYVISTTAPTTTTKWKTLKTSATATIKKPASGSKLYFRAAPVAKEMKGPGETYVLTYEKTKLTATATKDEGKVKVTFPINVTGKITVVSGEATVGTGDVSGNAQAATWNGSAPSAKTDLVIKVELTGVSKKLYYVEDIKFTYEP